MARKTEKLCVTKVRNGQYLHVVYFVIPGYLILVLYDRGDDFKPAFK